METKINYLSYLSKIRHKGIIIEHIFSFIKNNPLILLDLIRYDKNLKLKLTNSFNSLKKSNKLSLDLNENINIILIYRKFIENYNFELSLDYESWYLNYLKTNLDISYIQFISNLIIEKIDKDKGKDKNYIINYYPSKKLINELVYNCIYNYINFYNIKLNYLIYLPNKHPEKGIEYYDGNYIKNRFINNKNKSYNSINILYCIIDENQYFNYIDKIDNDIVIDKIYFIIFKRNKNPNIFNAIKTYLSNINLNNINKIVFGESFFKGELNEKITIREYYSFLTYEGNYYNYPIMEFLDDEIFINQKKIKISKEIKLELKTKEFNGDYSKLYLGMSLLFENEININNVNIINSKNYTIKNFSKENEYVIIKIDNFEYGQFIEKAIEFIGPYQKVIFYLDNNNIRKNQLSKLYFYLSNISNDFLFYSEKPVDNDFYKNGNIITNNNNILMVKKYSGPEKYIKNKPYIYGDNILDYIFLIKKYRELHFKFCYYSFYNEELRTFGNINIEYKYPNKLISEKGKNENYENIILNYIKKKFNLTLELKK